MSTHFPLNDDGTPKPCPVCSRQYCDHTLAERGDGVASHKPAAPQHAGTKLYAVKRPCAECPFSKTVQPGTLGGSDVSVYVGQAIGPFWLPCHMDTDFQDPNWKQDITKAQCAGAAIFRANLGISDYMPDFLHRLPPDTLPALRQRRSPDRNTVLSFASHAELVAHHRQCSVTEAEAWLEKNPPTELLRVELNKIEAKRRAVPAARRKGK